MESLENVVAILRYEGRQDLSALLVDAYVNFECLDLMTSPTSDAMYELTHAAIFAPISACTSLRKLSIEDKELILDAIRDAWPTTEAGGMAMHSLSFQIKIDSLREDITRLYTNPVGWRRVDRTMDRIRDFLVIASTEEQFEELGVLCRDVLISVAQVVFDPRLHPTLPNDDTDVSETDVKRMLARYVFSECPGPSNQEVRKCVNSAVDLANKVTHSRTSVYREAAFCVQATVNVIGLIAIISGKRDREELRPSAESGSPDHDGVADLPY